MSTSLHVYWNDVISNNQSIVRCSGKIEFLTISWHNHHAKLETFATVAATNTFARNYQFHIEIAIEQYKYCRFLPFNYGGGRTIPLPEWNI